MAAVTKRQLRVLQPYLEGERPNEVGEWGMHCPFHDDKNRSASISVRNGLWHCQVCNIGGHAKELVREVEARSDTETKAMAGGGRLIAGFVDEDGKPVEPPAISESEVVRYHETLLKAKVVRKEFTRRRGLTVSTLKRFQIGWDTMKSAYTIPIRDKDGRLVNLRRYQLDPPEGRRKIWGLTGHNNPALFPISELDDTSEIIICEGELDALILIQNGFSAVTRTGAADVWRAGWNTHFDDKVVYVCHDRDEKGQKADVDIMHALRSHAREVHKVELPYEVAKDHGKDLTDYFHEDGHTAEDFQKLMDDSEGVMRDPEVAERELVDVGVLDSFSSANAGKRLRMRVTITGKRSPTFLLPSDVKYSCTQSAGVKCLVCPMNEMGGRAVRHIDSHDPVVLEMMGATANQLEEDLRKHLGAQKCPLLEIEVVEYRSVEELYVRPSVDRSRHEEDGDYTTRKIISVGRHDSMPNNTVEVVGAIFPSPRGQHNELQAWELSRLETSVDNFEVTPEIMAELEGLQSRKPLGLLADVSRWLTNNVTHIVGRLELHALMDLVWHSVIAFDFDGQRVERGWLDVLIVGDTRTGKSEVADKMLRLYDAGEMVSCESASFAGIVGGLQQMGNGKEWEITWGAIPINDRRLVVLDEISGLLTEQIAQMSSIRSSGEAQLTKIRSERTWARTRLIWMGNPRNGRMADYTYGVQAIRPLVGNNEDIARFDLAMSVRADEVKTEDINKSFDPDDDGDEQAFTPSQLRHGVLWAWSRKAEDVEWGPGAEEAVYAAAMAFGDRYIETPPLLQAANARIKIARIAVALAARCFSSPDGKRLVVKKVHVADAVKFIDRLYTMPGFGYSEISKEAIQDAKDAERFRDEAKAYLVSSRGLSKFLRSMTGSFRRQDLEDMLNLSKEEANGVVGTLWKLRLITRQGPNIKVQPTLHELLREVKE